ncbi:hypothetical protein LQ948_01010 [Jiella sp. MQZ9-1]|uniref:MFS transporter n=1 Tax=Jiella flava TaxID=2816857 RepID=A0A939FUQ3_9HYPH|nr:hypothetical protein [Jiella flava]MBO0661141.1 hypothetical protein [Jiella flava]MCD2469787.1 hypothetical protein [Jiella flava]
MLSATAGANLAIGLWSAPASILIFMALMGVSFGLYAPLFGAVWPERYGTAHLGAIKSLVRALMVFGTAVGA